MKILMHICCGPCTIYPLKELRNSRHEVTGVFFNPNIHPYQEYLKRKQTLKEYAQKNFLDIIWADKYPLEEFLRAVSGLDKARCNYCLSSRLKHTAQLAKNQHYDGFTSTLLYSKYQKHDLIKEIGEKLSREIDISFYYQDFRVGWSEGVKISKEQGMYRQSYCGCIYSEKERFYK
jgi:epoxyqueuosine reductase